MHTISCKELRQLLLYEPDTGVFRRIKIVDPHSRVNIGDIAGSVSHGYRRIKLGGRAGRAYGAHRLAWLYMMGEWPNGEVDHIDGNPDNNRWANLRLADRSNNTANSRRRSDNTSGVKGVHFDKSSGKWRSELSARGRRIFLGYFTSPEAAAAAYEAAALQYFGEFARVA